MLTQLTSGDKVRHALSLYIVDTSDFAMQFQELHAPRLNSIISYT